MVPMVNTISSLFKEFHNIFLTNISLQFLADKLLNKRRIKKTDWIPCINFYFQTA